MIPIILDHTRPQVTDVHVRKKLLLTIISWGCSWEPLRPFAGASEGQAGLQMAKSAAIYAIDSSIEGFEG